MIEPTDKTKLYLLPTPLGDINETVTSLYERIGKNNFDLHIVESEKKAREHLKLLYPQKDIRNINRVELNEHSIHSDIVSIIRMARGKSCVLMPDTGEPGIADPGSALIREAHKENYEIIPLLFTSSITASLACSGLNGQNFTFNGYLPKDKSARIKALKRLEQISSSTGFTQIFIETPYRNKHLWKDLIETLHDATDLSLSIELFTQDSKIMTALVTDWKRMKWPELQDKNAVFLLNSSSL